jgi:hypothetical protein
VISQLVIKHFSDNYSDFNIDYFGHIWDENNSDYSMYSDNIIVEQNKKYEGLINDIYKHTNLSNHNTWVKTRAKSQISNLISICKAIDCFKTKTINIQEYNYVILYRLDYIVWEKIKVPTIINENTFYLNKHGLNEKSGENVFILHPNKLQYFTDLLSDIRDGNIIPETHMFYYNYFVNIKKMTYELLNYDVGNNCEQVTLLHQYHKNSFALQHLLRGNEILTTLKR